MHTHVEIGATLGLPRRLSSANRRSSTTVWTAVECASEPNVTPASKAVGLVGSDRRGYMAPGGGEGQLRAFFLNKLAKKLILDILSLVHVYKGLNAIASTSTQSVS